MSNSSNLLQGVWCISWPWMWEGACI